MARPRLESLLLVFLFTFIRSATSQYDADSCMTPENTLGSCINLQQCPSLYNELRNAPVSQRVVVQRKLIRYNCGFDGQEPKVCCDMPPATASPPTTPTPTTSTATTPTIISKLGVYSEPPPNVSAHPNLYLLPNTCGNSEEDRIVNGNKTGIYQFPWMAVINYRDRRGLVAFECGGSIINDRYILTAAHCLTELGINKTVQFVRVGEHNLRTPTDCQGSPTGPICAPPVQNIRPERLIPHPGYTRSTKVDDIGLIRLATPIESRMNIEPICLPSTPELANVMLENTSGVVTGWGRTENRTGSDELLQVSLPILNQKACGDIYNRSISTRIGFRQLCAGGVGGRDSCGGDSGGPLQIIQSIDYSALFTQYGIVSYGPIDCGLDNRPGIYTRVPYYMDWILDQMQP